MTLRVEAKTSNHWTKLAQRQIPRGHWQEDHPLTLALPGTTAKTFRLTIETKRPLSFAFIRLGSAARMDNWQAKAGFSQRSLGDAPAPQQQSAAWIQPDRIVDLSSQMAADGTLSWTPPDARAWTVLRFGHVNTGARNGPAPPEATGFECNKLNADAAAKHFNGYIGRISAPDGPASHKLNGMVLDSWECHTQTWTPGMEKEFAKRRGYELRRWLPALTGRVVGDFDQSERFLRDWRATVNDLLVENFFSVMSAMAHQRGLTVSFETAVGDGQPGDILQYFSKADVPMCEFWQPDDPQRGGRGTKPMMPCISAAHIYGKRRIAAESFTSVDLHWNEYPGMLKHFADYNLALGLTHLVFHTYTHNPRLGVVPGTSFGAGIGTPFLRGQTWWKNMPAFTEYLTRCQFMLEQGRPVADVLWYLGDELDNKPREDAPFPAGYRFDYCNQDVLLHRLSVSDGLLQTPEGLTWRVLWLRHCPRLAPETLRRLRELLKAGATIVGEPPRASATLSGGAAADREFHELVTELWGRNAAQGDRKIGPGRLLWGLPLAPALTKLHIEPDLAGTNEATWCHRQSNDQDIYFIAVDKKPLHASLHFRAKGRPQQLDPLTGKVENLAVFQTDDAGTFIPLCLPASGSTFIVFQPGAPTQSITRVAHDGQTVFDAQHQPALHTREPVVVRAVYGEANNAQRQVDVTQQVRGRLARGEFVIPANNDLAGDPALGVVKTLVVTLRTDTGEKTLHAREGQSVHVPPPPPPVLAPCSLREGGTRLVAWEDGGYEISRGPESKQEVNVSGTSEVPLTGPWTLAFPPGWDTPAQVELPTLKPWSELAPPAVKYFSGSATYSTTVSLRDVNANRAYLLDLGAVANMADVKVNGQSAGFAWTSPCRLDVTHFVTAGTNRIEIIVTNPWRNRLIYDASKPAAERKTWTIAGPPANSPPDPAGLIGPVTIHVGVTHRIE